MILFSAFYLTRVMKHIYQALIQQSCTRWNPVSSFCKGNIWFYRTKSDLHYQHKQVLFVGDVSKTELPHFGMYQTILDVNEFDIKNICGGFQRRPELIRQKQPDHHLLNNFSCHNVSYGLNDKCERIQQELTLKILDLLQLEENRCMGKLMLDIGCGRGWSLRWPSRKGFCVTGIDMDMQALSVVQHKTDSKYLSPECVQVVRGDISYGLCFRENTFDYALSVSFLQWLCVQRNTKQVLDRFFYSLSTVLKPRAKAGIQFYPSNVRDVQNVISEMEKYFVGALVSDYPHIDRGRKLFLLMINKKEL